MRYTQNQALTALAYCRELADELGQWADSFSEEECDAAARSHELVERVDRFLERIEQEPK
jgi:hypothetical protein